MCGDMQNVCFKNSQLLNKREKKMRQQITQTFSSTSVYFNRMWNIESELFALYSHSMRFSTTQAHNHINKSEQYLTCSVTYGTRQWYIFQFFSKWFCKKKFKNFLYILLFSIYTTFP